MRTKTLLSLAALLAAGVATSMAQSNVYSLNVVGYYNVVVPPNTKELLVGNQLNNTSGSGNNPTNMFGPGNANLAGLQIAVYNPDGSLPGFSQTFTYDADNLAWDPGTETVDWSPGKALYLKLGNVGAPATLTFVGEVL